jgi:transposase-like protein
MHSKRTHKLAASATPWDHLDDSELTSAQALVAAGHRSAYRFRHESFDGDADFFNSFERKTCPYCNSMELIKFGFDTSGIRRYRCKVCTKTFTPVTGTIFEEHKLPLPAWSDFLVQLFSFESINVITREDRRSETTIPYWIAKVFAVLEGIQDKMVLTGRVQIDETFYPVPIAEEVSVDGKRLRGLSRNKICIAVGCDDSGRSFYARAGFGKPSTKRAMEAYGLHIKNGSLLIHDMEKAHRKLVQELELKEEVHNSKLISRLDDSENPLREVNRLCFLLKRFLDSHSGFNRENLDGWLNLFSVIMNQPSEKMEKAAMVLNRAMDNFKTLRFRDFYRS